MRVTIYVAVLAVALALFYFAPQTDLATSSLFYVAGRGFAFADWPPAALLYSVIPWIAWGIFAIAAAAAIWLFLVGRPLWLLDRRTLIFLIASTALGPGVLANTVFKDHWGRARPSQIEAFGGTRQFTAAPLLSTECLSNCAFVSGHAALGFSLVAFAFLFPAGRSRRVLAAAAFGFGAVVGLGRIIQGAHFLSDVVFAGLLVYGTTAVLHWWIVERDSFASPPLRRVYRRLARGAATASAFVSEAVSGTAIRLALIGSATLILVVLVIGFVDRPLALFFHARDADLRTLFELTGRLGLTYGYLIVFGLTFAALHWGGALPRLRPFAGAMRAVSAVPAFLFLSIAASGVAVDVLKLVFGRLRPKLLFGSGLYEFSWFGLRPDHWSFPSGHSATIVALMTGLWFLWPQHVLFYVLVAAIVATSRVVVGAHYLSDVFAGALVGMLTTWAVAAAFGKSGIDLAEARRANSAIMEQPPWPCRRFGSRTPGGDRTELRKAGPVARDDRENCNIAPKADCGFRIDTAPWPCASKPSITPAVEIPSIRR